MLLCLMAVGCGDPLDHGEIIRGARVLGARVRVEDEPSRAWPRPGERATVEWLVVSHAPPPALGWGFYACAEADVRVGLPACQRAPFASVVSSSLSTEPPLLSLTVPDLDALGDAVALAIVGAVCADGNAQVDPDRESASCDSDSTAATLASVEVGLARDGRSNQNPSIEDDRIELDGRQWDAPSGESMAPGSECAATAALVATAGSDALQVRFTLARDDREPLTSEESPSGDARETLTLSHLATGGDLERQFSVIESTEPSATPSVSVDWSPPEQAPSGGILVRFVFVLRDGRGGTDWTMRDVCVTP
jgi:hypothetical protein